MVLYADFCCVSQTKPLMLVWLILNASGHEISWSIGLSLSIEEYDVLGRDLRCAALLGLCDR